MRALSLFVLLLSLLATQFSGNAFFAFTGVTYRIGFSWILSVYFMLAIYSLQSFQP